jgi:hypothetical protein
MKRYSVFFACVVLVLAAVWAVDACCRTSVKTVTKTRVSSSAAVVSSLPVMPTHTVTVQVNPTPAVIAPPPSAVIVPTPQARAQIVDPPPATVFAMPTALVPTAAVVIERDRPGLLGRLLGCLRCGSRNETTTTVRTTTRTR